MGNKLRHAHAPAGGNNLMTAFGQACFDTIGELFSSKPERRNIRSPYIPREAPPPVVHNHNHINITNTTYNNCFNTTTNIDKQLRLYDEEHGGGRTRQR